MAGVKEIEIEGFKAFPNKFNLALNKHLLLYGENGSGKSSIYYALHALLQSVYKSDQGAKYFNHEDSEENLINIFKLGEIGNNGFMPHVKITLDNGHQWKLNRNGLSCIPNTDDDSELRLLNKTSAFINYSYISRFRSARNSETMDLWNVFIKDILPFYVPSGKDKTLADTYYELVSNRYPYRVQKDISKFNENLSDFIDRVNSKASDIYNQYFKENDEADIVIQVKYAEDDDKPNNPHNEEFRLSFKRRTQKSAYDWRYPKIGLHIEVNNIIIQKPQSFFNEARLTAIALAIRFACLQGGNPQDGQFLALDDMLISLDMSNRMKVIRYLLDYVADKYKIYLFTHDRLFYHCLKRIIETQYSKGEWMFGGLYLNDLDSHMEPEFMPETTSKINKAREAYKRHDYFRCGTLLRQSCEQHLKELLPDSYRIMENPQTGKTENKNLDQQILSLQEFCNKEIIDYMPFKDLKTYKDLFMNATAHNDITSPFFRDEIKRCLYAIEALSQIKRSEKIDCKKELSFSVVDSTDKKYTIRLKRREKLRLLEYDGEKKLSYFCKCTVTKFISDSGSEDIDEGFDSIYQAYDHICNKLGIQDKQPLLDVLKDRNGLLLNRIS
ncbi:MAG: AAA family ATPase [Prevotella koreensis]|uniref:AAA family ATPase n=1 Tax=Prevotella koreensis TaxID=2490854 RepID=UPI003FA120C4